MLRITTSLALALLTTAASRFASAATLRHGPHSAAHPAAPAASPAAAPAAAVKQGPVDSTALAGTNPIAGHFDTQYLGFQRANNSCSHRDLGFTGRIADKWYATWGDALWCAEPVSDPEKDTPGFHGMVRDAVSLMTDDPLVVQDLHLNTDTPVPHQQQLVPFNPFWGETGQFGFGGTSFCETDAASKTAALFYLVNANEAGLKGAGVAKVEVQKDGTPLVTKRFGDQTGWWWDYKTTARYGDVMAYRDELSDYIYAWGGSPASAQGLDTAYAYLARVKASQAFDLGSYEYWWGFGKDNGGWKKDVLNKFGAETATSFMTGQGQVLYSQFWKCYIFVRVGAGNSGEILLRTATALEGPWTPDVKVYTAKPDANGWVYSGVAHPYLDASGQTLTVSWTNNNHIQVARVSFKK